MTAKIIPLLNFLILNGERSPQVLLGGLDDLTSAMMCRWIRVLIVEEGGGLQELQTSMMYGWGAEDEYAERVAVALEQEAHLVSYLAKASRGGRAKI